MSRKEANWAHVSSEEKLHEADKLSIEMVSMQLESSSKEKIYDVAALPNLLNLKISDFRQVCCLIKSIRY